MKLELSPLTSDILIAIYISVSLFFRIKMEFNAPPNPINSILIGIGFVVILYILIKVKFLNPNWFGLFNSKKEAK